MDYIQELINLDYKLPVGLDEERFTDNIKNIRTRSNCYTIIISTLESYASNIVKRRKYLKENRHEGIVKPDWKPPGGDLNLDDENSNEFLSDSAVKSNFLKMIWLVELISSMKFLI